MVHRGIIIMASTVQSKATKLFCRCSNCDDVQEIAVKSGLGKLIHIYIHSGARLTQAHKQLCRCLWFLETL